MWRTHHPVSLWYLRSLDCLIPSSAKIFCSPILSRGFSRMWWENYIHSIFPGSRCHGRYFFFFKSSVYRLRNKFREAVWYLLSHTAHKCDQTPAVTLVPVLCVPHFLRSPHTHKTNTRPSTEPPGGIFSTQHRLRPQAQ